MARLYSFVQRAAGMNYEKKVAEVTVLVHILPCLLPSNSQIDVYESAAACPPDQNDQARSPRTVKFPDRENTTHKFHCYARFRALCSATHPGNKCQRVCLTGAIRYDIPIFQGEG